MSECKWDASKHGGKPCPVHGGAGNPGAGGHKIRINNGKYETRISDDADWEEVSPEEYADLREGGYQDFDETVDDDFGFDEEDVELNEFEDNFTENDIKEIERYAEHYDVDTEELKQKIWDRFNEKIKDGTSVTNAKNDAMEEVLDDVVSGKFNENDEAADPIQQGLDYIKKHYSEQEFGSLQSFMEKRMNDWTGKEKAEIAEAYKNSQSSKDKYSERSRISLDIPKYHTEPDENGGSNIVIDEGRFKGNRYSSEDDFSSTENANEEAFRDRLLKFMKDNGHDVDDKWFDEYPEENKQSMRDYFSDKDSRDALMNEAEKPENKKKIIEKAKEMRPWYRNPIFSDEEIWKALSFDDIKKLLGE